jgi:hypothetical protein
VLWDDGAGEVPVRRGLAALARHGAGCGEQKREKQNEHPCRGHSVPASGSLQIVVTLSSGGDPIAHEKYT